MWNLAFAWEDKNLLEYVPDYILDEIFDNVEADKGVGLKVSLQMTVVLTKISFIYM